MIEKKHDFIDWSDNLLLEGIDSLGDNIIIYDEVKKNEVWENWEKKFPQHFENVMGRVNWNNSKRCYQLEKIEEIQEYKLLDKEVFIIWDNQNFILSTDMMNIINNYDDVVAVSFDTWFVAVDFSFVIENHHEGEIVLGFD